MSYTYETEREKLFTEAGQRTFLAIRDHVKKLLANAGAFKASAAWRCPHSAGDSWLLLACLDRLVELGEIRRVNQGRDVAGQDELYTSDGD